jgi:hypothetical protein
MHHHNQPERSESHMKTKTITLSFLDAYAPFQGKPAWRVERLTDSVAYAPGQMLQKHEVDALCGSSQWKVTVQPLPKH